MIGKCKMRKSESRFVKWDGTNVGSIEDLLEDDYYHEFDEDILLIEGGEQIAQPGDVVLRDALGIRVFSEDDFNTFFRIEEKEIA